MGQGFFKDEGEEERVLQSIESVEIKTHGSLLTQSTSFLNKAITLSIESICNLLRVLRLGLGFNFRLFICSICVGPFEVLQSHTLLIFQRYPRPEKECQSFSLIYNDRSLDLICKDKDEAEQRFIGLKALSGHQRKWRTESRSDGIPFEANSPRTYTQRSSPLNSPFGSGDSLQKAVECAELLELGSRMTRFAPFQAHPHD